MGDPETIGKRVVLNERTSSKSGKRNHAFRPIFLSTSRIIDADICHYSQHLLIHIIVNLDVQKFC